MNELIQVGESTALGELAVAFGKFVLTKYSKRAMVIGFGAIAVFFASVAISEAKDGID